eukprot:NODE_8471_length_700_cov_72.887348_g8215_i0.p2 GENE.NODE_8471_length_700_cov_72.887348_g8215_i0~~NODE_8471_length_700_cov_72.887348_g8215_i0.p2  ORF type:complete len:175 (+),score=35.36 NODE_8471_length_700_cov_72.887348_g8215_i0:56-580(+)
MAYYPGSQPMYSAPVSTDWIVIDGASQSRLRAYGYAAAPISYAEPAYTYAAPTHAVEPAYTYAAPIAEPAYTYAEAPRAVEYVTPQPVEYAAPVAPTYSGYAPTYAAYGGGAVGGYGVHEGYDELYGIPSNRRLPKEKKKKPISKKSTYFSYYESGAGPWRWSKRKVPVYVQNQ